MIALLLVVGATPAHAEDVPPTVLSVTSADPALVVPYGQTQFRVRVRTHETAEWFTVAMYRSDTGAYMGACLVAREAGEETCEINSDFATWQGNVDPSPRHYDVVVVGGGHEAQTLPRAIKLDVIPYRYKVNLFGQVAQDSRTATQRAMVSATVGPLPAEFEGWELTADNREWNVQIFDVKGGEPVWNCSLGYHCTEPGFYPAAVAPGTYVARVVGTNGEIFGESEPLTIAADDPELVGLEQLGGGHPALPDLNRTCAGKPVNCATGNQYESQTDLAVGGRGVGLDLTRTYNSQAAKADGPFGHGWTATFFDRLELDAASGRAMVRHADGSAVSFWVPKKETAAILPASQRTQSKLERGASGTFRYVLPDQTIYSFSASGRLTSVADRNANTTRLSYDAAGRLTKVTDPAGRTLQYTWSADGHITSATDPTGLRVKYAYAAGDLVDVSYDNSATAQWRFGYDGAHQMTRMTDGRGSVTTTEYDSARRVIRQTDALNRVRRWQYLANETRITQPSGAVTRHLYRADRQPRSTTVGYGTAAATTRTFAYDTAGSVTSVTDGSGRKTSTTYDEQGNVATTTDALGRTTEFH